MSTSDNVTDNSIVEISPNPYPVASILNLVVALVGIIGNSLVMLAVLFSRKLQTSSNAFIVNLAVTDVLLCVTLPLYAASELVRTYTPVLEPICRIIVGLSHICVGCSVYTLSAIGLNRYILISSPNYWYSKIFQRKFIFIWIAFLWTTAASISILPPLAFDVGKIGFDPVEYCNIIPDHDFSDLYETILALAYYPVPLIIIFMSYLGILIKIRSHTRRMKRHSKSTRNDSTSPVRFEIDVENRATDQSSGVSPLQIAVTKNMFFIVCAFLICISPHSICLLTKCHFTRYTSLILAANSAINPMIYGLNHPIFRQVFASLFRCRSVPEPSPFLLSLNRKITLTTDLRSSTGNSL